MTTTRFESWQDVNRVAIKVAVTGLVIAMVIGAVFGLASDDSGRHSPYQLHDAVMAFLWMLAVIAVIEAFVYVIGGFKVGINALARWIVASSKRDTAFGKAVRKILVVFNAIGVGIAGLFVFAVSAIAIIGVLWIVGAAIWYTPQYANDNGWFDHDKTTSVYMTPNWLVGEYKTCTSDGKATVLDCGASYANEHEMAVTFSGNISGSNMDGVEIVGSVWQCRRGESGISCKVQPDSYRLKPVTQPCDGSHVCTQAGNQ